jgi:hypothetical protein
LPDGLKKWINLWDVVDLLAFTAGTVFRLSDGSKPQDIPVEDPISVMLDAGLWLHSIYWQTPQLVDALVKAFRYPAGLPASRSGENIFSKWAPWDWCEVDQVATVRVARPTCGAKENRFEPSPSR